MINMNPINPLSQIDKTANIRQTDDPQKLMEVCKEFESIFINMILKQARSGMKTDGLTEKSYAREIFEDMQDEQMAQSMSKGQGIGLAQELYKQLSRNTNKITNMVDKE
ncbi:rod-binding protein [Alkaliphilus sp. MSJ-5]|uniref:Rod-binding protein n=1 Tax=Alkaliphilus flagellatus TaxID=2841507 RepID=A0ABS6G2B2_9FIRM|nr:rod-binding protein [Alkaliphilus flagellatus]MBU5676611.1 rod-binding protein [Alkaliphilus flagellatus]